MRPIESILKDPLSGPHPSPLCKYLSEVQTWQTSTICNGYHSVIRIQVAFFSIQIAIIFVNQGNMTQGGSFRIRSEIIAPLTSISGKSFVFHCVEQGEISKCHGTMDLFRYLLMLMDQSYLISWNLQCLLPGGRGQILAMYDYII